MTRGLGNLAKANLARSTNRREVLKYGVELGAATFAAGVAVSAVASEVRGSGGGGGGAGKVVFQKALHEGYDEAVASPVPGVQADGTTLWRVQVAAMDMEAGIDAQGFFPGEITINAGDSVWFEGKMPGFHTVTFLGAQEMPPGIIPDPGAGTPEAGVQPPMMFNPVLAYPNGDPVWDGVEILNSGLDVLRADAGPFVVTFTEPGTYDYFCFPHQLVMKARVIVQEAGSELTQDQAAYDQLAQKQIAQVIEEGKAAAAQYGEAVPGEAGSGVDWVVSAGAGEGQGRVMKFLPENFTIKKGRLSVGSTDRSANRIRSRSSVAATVKAAT
jgi:plastocyanin